MRDKATRATPDGAPSKKMLAVLSYAKFLDDALSRLPASFHYTGRVYRGVKWVYPRPDDHDPSRMFPEGGLLCWYDFKSTSRDSGVMTNDQFCGMGPGASPAL